MPKSPCCTFFRGILNKKQACIPCVPIEWTDDVEGSRVVKIHHGAKCAGKACCFASTVTCTAAVFAACVVGVWFKIS